MLRQIVGVVEEPASRACVSKSPTSVGYSKAKWFSRATEPVSDPGLRHRNGFVGFGDVEHAETMVAFVGPQETRAVVGGLNTDRRLKNVEVPLLHHFVVAGVHNKVSKFRWRHVALFPRSHCHR